MNFDSKGLAFWTMEERNEFKTAWIKYGKDFSLIQKHVRIKSYWKIIHLAMDTLSVWKKSGQVETVPGTTALQKTLLGGEKYFHINFKIH